MKKYLLKNIMILFAFILGIATSITIVYAVNTVSASQVIYSSTTVDDALSKLSSNANKIKDVKKFCELKSGTAETVGSKYECDPGDGTKRNFYVLTVKENSIDLIMEKNITDTVGSAKSLTWNNAMVFFTTGAGVETRNNWVNIQKIDLPEAQAIADAVENDDWDAANNNGKWWCLGDGLQDSTTSPYCTNANQENYAWLFNYLKGCAIGGCTDASGATVYGYWTRDLVYNNTKAWVGYRNGNLANITVSTSDSTGVRPVITVLKSNLY